MKNALLMFPENNARNERVIPQDGQGIPVTRLNIQIPSSENTKNTSTIRAAAITGVNFFIFPYPIYH